jgi:hypothetical protein
LDHAALPGEIEPDGVMSIGPKEVIDADPAGGCDLGIQSHCRPGAQDEDVWTDGNWREDWGSGHHVLQPPRQIAVAELDTDFLVGFSNGCGQEIRVSCLAAAARQGHVAGPGVAGALGPADQKDGVWIRSENYRNRSPYERGIIVVAGLLVSQMLAQASEPAPQCECDWQPPDAVERYS